MEKHKRMQDKVERGKAERVRSPKVVALRPPKVLHVGPQPKRTGVIVSSSHLADSVVPELSEFEFGLIVVGNAFDR